MLRSLALLDEPFQQIRTDTDLHDLGARSKQPLPRPDIEWGRMDAIWLGECLTLVSMISDN